jgi:hypothetical protein
MILVYPILVFSDETVEELLIYLPKGKVMHTSLAILWICCQQVLNHNLTQWPNPGN